MPPHAPPHPKHPSLHALALPSRPGSALSSRLGTPRPRSSLSSHYVVDHSFGAGEASQLHSLNAENYLDSVALDFASTTLTLVTIVADENGDSNVTTVTGSDACMTASFLQPAVDPKGKVKKPGMTHKFLLGTSPEDDESRMPLPISRKCLEEIVKELHLPTMAVGLSAQGYYARYGTTCLSQFEHGQGDDRLIGLIFSFRDAFVGGPRAWMAITHNPSSTTTHTIFFARNATKFDTIADLHDHSSSSSSESVFHPSHAAMLFADSVRFACDSQHEWLANVLVDVEMMSGFQSYSYPYTYSVDTIEESEKLDFVTSLQKLKRISDGNSANAGRRVNLDRVLGGIQGLSGAIERAAERRRGGSPSGNVRVGFSLEVLQEQRASVGVLRSWCDGLESRQEFIHGRIQWQLAIIPSYLAHRDSKINISIARDSKGIAAASKHDSTAMKTVSFLTAAFLPGTFIAAVFAMPLFEWDAVAPESVMSSRFWIFWAVTLPLTTIVFGGTVFWTWKQQRAVKQEGEDAQAELWSL